MSEPVLVEIRDRVARFSDGSTLAIPVGVHVRRDEVHFAAEEHLPPAVLFRIAVAAHPDAIGLYVPASTKRSRVEEAVRLIDSLPKEDRS